MTFRQPADEQPTPTASPGASAASLVVILGAVAAALGALGIAAVAWRSLFGGFPW